MKTIDQVIGELKSAKLYGGIPEQKKIIGTDGKPKIYTASRMNKTPTWEQAIDYAISLLEPIRDKKETNIALAIIDLTRTMTELTNYITRKGDY